jgi:hypothetical protein
MGLGQQPLQPAFALYKGMWAVVLTVEFQKIEPV